MSGQQDSDGHWRQAIPLPFYGARWTWLGPREAFICTACKPHAKFRTEQAYRDHYRSDHYRSDRSDWGAS